MHDPIPCRCSATLPERETLWGPKSTKRNPLSLSWTIIRLKIPKRMQYCTFHISSRYICKHIHKLASNHWGLMTHICINELGHIGLYIGRILRLVSCLAPSHYLDQWWRAGVIGNCTHGTIFGYIWIKMYKFILKEMRFKMSVRYPISYEFKGHCLRWQ